MKEIRTRPKERNIRTRQTTAFRPKQAVKLLWERAATRRLQTRESEDREGERSNVTQEAVSRFETAAEKTARIGSRSAFRSGKLLAQKQFDQQFTPITRKWNQDGEKTCGQSESPLTVRAKQRFRRTQAKKQQVRRQETAAKAEINGSLRVQAVLTDGEQWSVQEQAFEPSVSADQSPYSYPQRGTASASSKEPLKKKPPRERLFTGRQDNAVRQQASVKARAQIIERAKQRVQRQVLQETAQQTRKTIRRAAKGFEGVKQAVIRAGQVVVRAAVGFLGGAGALIALTLVIGGAAAVIGTPFGIFWSGSDADAQSVPQAVAQINREFTEKIAQIQADHPADSVVIHREPDGGSDLAITNWTDIIAVFAVKTADAGADAADVVTIDDERVEMIRQVFWDMNAVDFYVQTIEHEDRTETILHITITSRKAVDMPEIYQFNKSQREALDEILKPECAQMLAELMGTYGGEVSLDQEQIRIMLAAMPEDISIERRAVVEKAYSLLGKVNYFWGGKSSAIGWDSRWGTPARVTAPGSRTTGTIRPYGLDCSGFVDWVFNNSLGYVIGHGGGAASQHTYCTPISWSETQPGDLVFYPGDTHVGVFVGKDANGDPLIIHCASSQNNVVLTGLQGFTAIGRPNVFSE